MVLPSQKESQATMQALVLRVDSYALKEVLERKEMKTLEIRIVDEKEYDKHTFEVLKRARTYFIVKLSAEEYKKVMKKFKEE